MLTRKMVFWSIWIAFSGFIIWFFYVLGELDDMDLGKAAILTLIPLIAAYPIYCWVKSNNGLFRD